MPSEVEIGERSNHDAETENVLTPATADPFDNQLVCLVGDPDSVDDTTLTASAPRTQKSPRNRGGFSAEPSYVNRIDEIQKLFVVREGGLEPPHPCEYWHLKPARLPIPPLAHVWSTEVRPTTRD